MNCADWPTSDYIATSAQPPATDCVLCARCETMAAEERTADEEGHRIFMQICDRLNIDIAGDGSDDETAAALSAKMTHDDRLHFVKREVLRQIHAKMREQILAGELERAEARSREVPEERRKPVWPDAD